MFLKRKVSQPLKFILRNPGINIADLKKLTTSLDNYIDGINFLQENELIYSVEKKNCRHLYPNYFNEKAFLIFEVVELEELLELKTKYPVIIKEIEIIARMIKRKFKDNINSILLFGSITRQSLQGESDIDLLILVENEKELKENYIHNLIRHSMTKLGKEISLVWQETKEHKSQLFKPTSFATKIQHEHTILEGATNFINLTKLSH